MRNHDRGPDERSDETLMCATGEGDAAAFDELVQRHHIALWRLAYRSTRSVEASQDITQQAFLKIYQAAPRYRPSACFKTYLYRVVTRLCIDHARKHKEEPCDSYIEPVSPEESAVLKMEKQDEILCLQRALSKLPSRQRLALILKYYEEMKYVEISDILNMTVKAVERVICRARKTLLMHLSDRNHSS